MSVLISHAFDVDKNIISIDEDIDFDCYCIECGEKLIPKKGKIYEYHFAHQAYSSCGGGSETLIHILAKKIILENKKIVVNIFPKYFTSKKFETIEFQDIFLEKKLGNIRPDIIGVSNGENYIIEIAVTHFCDKEKINKIRELNIKCIEIDLSFFKEKNIKIKEIENYIKDNIINYGTNSYYLYNNIIHEDYKKEIILEVNNFLENKNTIKELIFKYRNMNAYFFNTRTMNLYLIENTWKQLNKYNGRYWYADKFRLDFNGLIYVDSRKEIEYSGQPIWIYIGKDMDSNLRKNLKYLYEYYQMEVK